MIFCVSPNEYIVYDQFDPRIHQHNMCLFYFISTLTLQIEHLPSILFRLHKAENCIWIFNVTFSSCNGKTLFWLWEHCSVNLQSFVLSTVHCSKWSRSCGFVHFLIAIVEFSQWQSKKEATSIHGTLIKKCSILPIISYALLLKRKPFSCPLIFVSVCKIPLCRVVVYRPYRVMNFL